MKQLRYFSDVWFRFCLKDFNNTLDLHYLTCRQIHLVNRGSGFHLLHSQRLLTGPDSCGGLWHVPPWVRPADWDAFLILFRICAKACWAKELHGLSFQTVWGLGRSGTERFASSKVVCWLLGCCEDTQDDVSTLDSLAWFYSLVKSWACEQEVESDAPGDRKNGKQG